MNLFKRKFTKYLILSLLSLFLVISCDNPSTTNDCKDKCSVDGDLSCNAKTLQVCKKLDNGCLALETVKECANSCENKACVGEESCDPICKDWESCEGTTCKLQADKCNTKTDCTDNKVCDTTHNCVEASNDCNPTCKDWENCLSGTCSLQAGKCNSKIDCEANQICEANSCIEDPAICNPTCNDWEDCNNGGCNVKPGKCNITTDCTDNKVCDTTTHSCVVESNDCNPVCKDWEDCLGGTCSLQAGKCNEKTDCEANQNCDNNRCIDEVVKKKTKISLGANKKMNSSNFKMKLNLGKVRTSKDMKSTSFKMKLGHGIK